MDCAIQRLNNLEQNNLNKHFIRFIFRPVQVFFKTLSIESGNEPASFQLCCQALYRMRLVQVKNGPRVNVSPAGEANLVQAMYRFLERSPQGTRDVLICKNAQTSFTWSRVDLARLLRTLRLIDFRPSWIISFELVSQLDSLLQQGRLYRFLYLLLSYFYDPSMFIFCWSFVENLLLEREHGGQDSIWCVLPCSLLLYRM